MRRGAFARWPIHGDDAATTNCGTTIQAAIKTGAQRAEQGGGVIEKEGGIHVSNVMLADPTDGKPTRIGIEIDGGRRFRVARRTCTRID